MYVIVTRSGNAIGPFNEEDAAIGYAKLWCLKVGWCIMEVKSPIVQEAH